MTVDLIFSCFTLIFIQSKIALNKTTYSLISIFSISSGFPSGDSSTDSDSDDDNNRYTIAEIIQRLQKSSSQPIPESIFKETSENLVHWQPYCHVTLKCTKEVAGYNTISEAFYKLDFCNAIRDIRRFNYISKLLHLLITQNLTSLSGCATKVLFTMLEQLAWQGIHIIHTIHTTHYSITQTIFSLLNQF